MFLSHHLQNHTDFDKNFVLIVLNIFATECCKCFPPYLNSASTLPCETQNSCFCENSNAGKAKLKKFYLLTLILFMKKMQLFDFDITLEANLIRRTCIKFCQNRPRFVKDMTKTFWCHWCAFRFTVLTAVHLQNANAKFHKVW